MLRGMKHVGKQAVKVTIELSLCDVRCVPPGVTHIAVCWERGQHVLSTRVAAVDNERLATLNSRLKLNATLYRQRNGQLAPKPSTLRVLDRSRSAPTAVIGEASLELGDVEPGARPRVKQVQMATLGNPAVPMLAQLSISVESEGETSAAAEISAAEAELRAAEAEVAAAAAAERPARAHKGELAPRKMGAQGVTFNAPSAAPERTGGSASGSASSSASGAKVLRTMSWGRGSKGKSDAGKGGERGGSVSASVESQLAAAQQEARHAEGLVTTLQHRLRTEVIVCAEETLERAAKLRHASEQARVYHEQLVLMLDQVARYAEICPRCRRDPTSSSSLRSQRAPVHAQVERIAYDEGRAVGGGGGVSPAEAELLQLRRDLAASKRREAEVAGERDELRHVAQRLTKQLADTVCVARFAARVIPAH